MGFSAFKGLDVMFTIVPVLVALGFVVTLAVIITAAVRNLFRWKRNNEAPVLILEARLVAKRADVSRHHHNHGKDMPMHHSPALYYGIFEAEGGSRMEFRLQDREYGLLAEGDRGKLRFQGTRYIDFERY